MASGTARRRAPPRLSRRAPQVTLTRCHAHLRERKKICSLTRPCARDALGRQHLQHAHAQQQVLHNIVYNFFSTCRHALRARTAPWPPRLPAGPPTPRAQPLCTRMHTHNLPHNKHTRTCTFPPPRHGPRNTTARLRAVYRPAPCGYLLGPRSRDDCLPPAYHR